MVATRKSSVIRTAPDQNSPQSAPPWRSSSGRAEGRRAESARRPYHSADQMEDEVELRAGRVVVLELHLTTCVAVGTRASGDRKNAVASVVEGALDRDLPL